MLRFALRRVDDPADAADVVAEVMSVAWRRRADLPQRAEQRLWLFGVARKALANQRRGKLRQAQLADRLRSELAVHAQPTREQDSPVLQALARLSVADRDLLALSAWEQLRPEEIATVLSCTPATARVRLHRARRRLRDALALEGLTHAELVISLIEETS
jgi:RNA polymerase sigma-70 factor (ECF subfamily)